jgi:hypothetical protein
MAGMTRASSRCWTIGVSPERHGEPHSGRTEPKLLARHGHVPAGRHHPVDLHWPAIPEPRD